MRKLAKFKKCFEGLSFEKKWKRFCLTAHKYRGQFSINSFSSSQKYHIPMSNSQSPQKLTDSIDTTNVGTILKNYGFNVDEKTFGKKSETSRLLVS